MAELIAILPSHLRGDKAAFKFSQKRHRRKDLESKVLGLIIKPFYGQFLETKISNLNTLSAKLAFC